MIDILTEVRNTQNQADEAEAQSTLHGASPAMLTSYAFNPRQVKRTAQHRPLKDRLVAERVWPRVDGGPKARSRKGTAT